MKVVSLKVRKPAEVVEIKKAYELNNLVGGSLECFYKSGNIWGFCDEEGRMFEKPANFTMLVDDIPITIVGDVIFVSMDSKGEIKDMLEEDISFLVEEIIPSFYRSEGTII
jgi:hypothetical protein